MNRRHALVAGLGVTFLRPAASTPASMQTAIAAFTGGAPLQTGRVVLEIAPLIDNGNAVPVAVRAESPMTAADHVTAIGLFAEQNPNAEMAVFHLGPRAGRATVSTRVRLATSQRVVAIAKMNDGRCWQHGVDVIVTLAACIEA